MTIRNDDPRLPSVLRTVRGVAMRLARRLPPSVSADDLVSAGYLGVATAMSRHAGDGDFESYAVAHARGAMIDELRRADPVGRRTRRLARKATVAVRRLRSDLGREPEVEEVARELGIPVERYLALCDRLRQVTVHADTCDATEERDDVVLVDEVASAEEQLDERRQRLRLQQYLARRIAKLPPRLALTITGTFFDERQLETIGREIGVTEGRVSQLRKSALGQLRAACFVGSIPPCAPA